MERMSNPMGLSNPKTLYSFYFEKIIARMNACNLDEQIKLLEKHSVKIHLIDLCGGILKYSAKFVEVEYEYYGVYDLEKCRAELTEVLHCSEVVYIVCDESVDINSLLGEGNGKNVFILR